VGERRDITIRPLTDDDREWIQEFLKPGGAIFIITCGRKVFPHTLPGFMAIDTDGKRVGLATYELMGDSCELVTLDALTRWSGIGTALIEKVAQAAREGGCRRLWLMTTNDNVDAIRFYQRRGMRLLEVHAGALDESRKRKPSIPNVGFYQIPMRDEVLFEMDL